MSTKMMNEVANKPHTNVESLLIVYKKQPVLHQQILQIKALLYFMTTKGDFVNGLSRSTLRAADGKKFNFANLNPILHQLQKKQLLTKDFSCNPIILHEITMDAISEHNTNASTNLSILSHFFNYKSDYKFDRTGYLNNVRVIHIATHLNNSHVFLNLSLARPENCAIFISDLISVFYQYSLNPKWIASRHPVIQLYLLCIKLYGFHGNINPSPPDLNQWINFIQKQDCVEIAIKNNLDKIPEVMSRLLQLSFAFKKLTYIEQCLPNLSEQQYYRYETQGGMAFFREDRTNAIQYYEKANKLFKSLFDKHEWFRGKLHGIFYVLALLYQNSSNEDLKKVASAIASLRKIHLHGTIPSTLDTLLALKRNDRASATLHYKNALDSLGCSPTIFPLLQALIDWSAILLQPEKLPELNKEHQIKFVFYRDASHYFTAQIYAELIQLYNANDIEAKHFLDQLSVFGQFSIYEHIACQTTMGICHWSIT